MQLSHLIIFLIGAIFAIAVIGALYFFFRFRMMTKAFQMHAQFNRFDRPQLSVQIHGLLASSVPEQHAEAFFGHLKSVPTVISVQSFPDANIQSPIRLEIQFDQVIESCQFIDEEVLEYELEKDAGVGHKRLAIKINSIKYGRKAHVVITTAQALAKRPLLSYSPKHAITFSDFGLHGMGFMLAKRNGNN